MSQLDLQLTIWESESWKNSTSFSPFSNLDKSSQCIGWELRTKLFGVVLFMSIFSKSLHLVAKFTLSRASSDIVQLYWFKSRPKMKKEKKHYSSNKITKKLIQISFLVFFSNIGHFSNSFRQKSKWSKPPKVKKFPLNSYLQTV